MVAAIISCCEAAGVQENKKFFHGHSGVAFVIFCLTDHTATVRIAAPGNPMHGIYTRCNRCGLACSTIYPHELPLSSKLTRQQFAHTYIVAKPSRDVTHF